MKDQMKPGSRGQGEPRGSKTPTKLRLDEEEDGGKWTPRKRSEKGEKE